MAEIVHRLWSYIPLCILNSDMERSDVPILWRSAKRGNQRSILRDLLKTMMSWDVVRFKKILHNVSQLVGTERFYGDLDLGENIQLGKEVWFQVQVMPARENIHSSK